MAIFVVATRRFLLHARCRLRRDYCAWRASLSKQDRLGRLPHRIQALGLPDVTVDGVRNLLGGVLRKMVVLPEHRTQSAYLPEQPLHDLGVAAQIGGEQLSGLVGQVLKNRTGFEHADRVAAPSTVHDRRDAAVGRDRQKLGAELLPLRNVHWLDRVRQFTLLEEDGELVAMRRRPVIKIDHSWSLKIL